MSYLNIENLETIEPNPAEQVLTTICATYPFLNEKEEQEFQKKVTNITTENPVQNILQILDALNNPHTSFRKVVNTQGEKKSLSQEMQPSSELVNNVMIIRIPSWNRDIDLSEISKLLDENVITADGVVLDVRNNSGGSSDLAFQFAGKFIPEGVYTFGTFIKRKPEEGLESFPATVQSKNRNPIRKPLVILTSKETFSSCEQFVAAMKASTDCTVIGEDTGGGVAFREEYLIDIQGQKYSVKIPTRRLILNGETEPIETTKIKPDVYYYGPHIVDYAVDQVKLVATQR
jgi:C-terminal processing protease CtpA/Prc